MPPPAAPSPPAPHPLASPLLLPRLRDPASPRPPPPPWREQLTLRRVVVAAVLGSLLCVVIHRLNLTVGIIPALNVASGLLAFFLATAWRGAAGRLALGQGRPFSRQENTVIQTCAIACGSLAFSVLFAWQKINRREADDYAIAVASGLICGDGVWSIPSAVLSILRVDPPICMSFRPSSASV
ncbi:hypothetical protein E2562_015037 [Oryza meyeriana var. granulata]|uniref:Uncharacterized protein n=1 Tax=Oryza meyeriana var. granulata TaxID=110450 RepID=A0A6G1ELS0_9ORYZ|nr:hypothetical protein E2562_015037 [Oryza meyeriana var. granulata]